MKDEMIADVLEAIEEISLLKPVYIAILRRTKDKKQAGEAVLFLRKMKRELDEIKSVDQ